MIASNFLNVRLCVSIKIINICSHLLVYKCLIHGLLTQFDCNCCKSCTRNSSTSLELSNMKYQVVLILSCLCMFFESNANDPVRKNQYEAFNIFD